MSDLDGAESLVSAWLLPLADDAAPCGADLEYDNDFLALNQAAAGKPESQFGEAEPPNWRAVSAAAEALFARTRDLRVAVLWLRANLHTQGYALLVPGLRLVIGLMRDHWDHLHPLPDPDDGDPYARVNALALLSEANGLIGDLRDTRLVADRAIGEVTGRAIEVALGLAPLREGENETSRAALQQMLEAALQKNPALRSQCLAAASLVQELKALQDEKFGSGVGPDLRPLERLVQGVASLLPAEAMPFDGAMAADADESSDGGPGPGGGVRRGLAGAVTSREEAIRAIDMVCEYLERAEPTNPAPLFLRRARQLISHNFLQLMKVLAPDALHEVAKVVGIDPDSIETPDGP